MSQVSGQDLAPGDIAKIVAAFRVAHPESSKSLDEWTDEQIYNAWTPHSRLKWAIASGVETTTPVPPVHAEEVPNLGPLPECHTREAAVSYAQVDLRLFLAELRKKYALTSAEFTAIVSHEAWSFAIRLVSIERRPEGTWPDCPKQKEPGDFTAEEIIRAANAGIAEQIRNGHDPLLVVLTPGCFHVLLEFSKHNSFKFEPKDLGFRYRPECPRDSVGVSVAKGSIYTLYTKIGSVPEKP